MSIAISIVLIIAALVMIVTVLLQSSDESGISALGGQSNSYFSKSQLHRRNLSENRAEVVN